MNLQLTEVRGPAWEDAVAVCKACGWRPDKETLMGVSHLIKTSQNPELQAEEFFEFAALADQCRVRLTRDQIEALDVEALKALSRFVDAIALAYCNYVADYGRADQVRTLSAVATWSKVAISLHQERALKAFGEASPVMPDTVRLTLVTEPLAQAA